jgi:outer membrane protein assembly factor BamE (lipoprotein component of BamABCDE complex)
MGVLIATSMERGGLRMVSKILMICLAGAFLLTGCASKERRAEKIRAQYPQWDQATVEKVASARVEVGMTPEMVRAALGEPDRVSREGGEEIWGYAIWIVPGEAPARLKFVYFVHFKEGKIVRTTGDRSALSHLNWYQ